MAEILIQWTSPEAARYASEPSLRRRGDVRAVGPNDNTWGREEDLRAYVAFHGSDVGWPDLYRVIQVQGISAPNLRKMVRRWARAAVEGDAEFVPVADRLPGAESDSGTVVEHQWAWRINLRELPQPKVNQLRDTGWVQITKAQFEAAVVHKALSRSFDENDPDGLGALRLPGSVD